MRTSLQDLYELVYPLLCYPSCVCMAFSCFGTGATSEDSTMRGYDGKLYNLEEHDINRHHESSSHKGISKLEQLASAEQCVFDVYSGICMNQCKLGIGETHWRRLLKQAGVLDVIPSLTLVLTHHYLACVSVCRVIGGHQCALSLPPTWWHEED